MPKRSLNPGSGDTKKIEQLNKAVDAMLARNDGRVSKAGTEIEPLVRIAADLRNLPSASFKARLKSEFTGRRSMSTVAEPVASVRVSASPRLAFRDPAKAIEFYTRALGAKEVFRFEVRGDIPHAELKIGDSSVNITGEWPEGDRFSAETLGNSPVWMTIQVPDVDAFAKHAVEEGMTVKRPLQDQFYGHRDVLLTDPFGYTWSVVTVKEEMSVEEMHRRMQRMMKGPEGGQMPKEEKGVDPVRRGFRRVTPYLVAADAPALLEFAKQTFGAEETMRAMTGTGVHGEVRIGDSMLMIGGGLPGQKFPATLHPNALHVYVEDTDAVFKKALAAGAKSLAEPADQSYGERSGSVIDAAGNHWYIATRKGANYKEEGTPTIQACLHPLRGEPVINFLKRAFGAEEVGGRHTTPEGVILHTWVKIGDSQLELGEAHAPYGPLPAMFYLYVPDVDGAYRQAVAAGAKVLHEPADQPYGDRTSAVTDAFGNTWYMATHVKDVAM
jgi:PhnB protein